jgi:hypothetical protein
VRNRLLGISSVPSLAIFVVMLALMIPRLGLPTRVYRLTLPARQDYSLDFTYFVGYVAHWRYQSARLRAIFGKPFHEIRDSSATEEEGGKAVFDFGAYRHPVWGLEMGRWGGGSWTYLGNHRTLYEGDRVYEVVISCHWIALMSLLGAMPFLVRIARNARARRRRSKNLCAACGYDLRASADRCPECGEIPSS